jgi:hypothetical protein
MRIAATLCGVLIGLSLLAGQTQLGVYVQNQRVGSAKVTETKGADGGIIHQIEFQMKAGTGEVSIHQIAEYGPDGTPRRKYTKQTSATGVEVRVVTFRGTTATLIIEKGGSTNTRSFPAPSGANIRARSELWFRTIQPKVGETDTYYRFDVNSAAWQKVTVKYEGDQALQSGGRELSCRVVSVNGMKSFLDAEGLPVRIEVGEMVMVREG